jgi:amino acid transporter
MEAARNAAPGGRIRKLLNLVVGRPLKTDEEEEHKVCVREGIPMLGLDALASSSYGPEAALTVLLGLGLAGLHYIGPLIGVILGLLAILYFSYRQTISAYPTGGGSYTVAKENLGVRFGLLAAAALLLDYVLNVAVAISAGVAALVSAFPALHEHTLGLCLGVLVLIAVVNLRGIRESGVAWSLPTYGFLLCLGTVLAIGLYRAIVSGGRPEPVVAPPSLRPAVEGAALWLLIRAFASGCTAMTGVEAVSNGISAFAEPAVKRAQATLTAIVVILASLLGGIGYLAQAYRVGAMPQHEAGYQSVVSQLVAAIVGRGPFYYVTIATVLSVLCLSANTSFAGFPRLCRLVAEDDYLPHSFANKGRRLVYSQGIVILSVLAGLLLLLFGGITDRLIPLFAVGAFSAFTLSQAGMVVHWRRKGGGAHRLSLAVNLLGALATGTALAVILIAKLTEGAWITLVVVPAALALFYGVRRHYEHVRREVNCSRPLDTANLAPPVVVIPVAGWDRITEKALRFGLRLSCDVIALHVAREEEQERELREEWARYVDAPLRRSDLPTPELVIVSSPYRHLITPLAKFIQRVEKRYPGRQVAVIIPELVEGRWWEFLLHNQRAALLRMALFLRGDRRLVMISVPWFLGEPDDTAAAHEDATRSAA